MKKIIAFLTSLLVIVPVLAFADPVTIQVSLITPNSFATANNYVATPGTICQVLSTHILAVGDQQIPTAAFVINCPAFPQGSTGNRVQNENTVFTVWASQVK